MSILEAPTTTALGYSRSSAVALNRQGQTWAKVESRAQDFRQPPNKRLLPLAKGQQIATIRTQPPFANRVANRLSTAMAHLRVEIAQWRR